jgi:hypothetical protein
VCVWGQLHGTPVWHAINAHSQTHIRMAPPHPTEVWWRVQDVVVSARGWRVKPDISWGVGPEEYELHVIDGWKLAGPYRWKRGGGGDKG